MYARCLGRAPRDPPATRAASPRRPGPPDTMGWAPRVRAEGREGEVEDGRFSSRVARDIGGLCHGESIDAVR